MSFFKILTVTISHFVSAPFHGGFFKIIFIISCSSASWVTVFFEIWVWVWTTVFTFTGVVSASWSIEGGFHLVKECQSTILSKDD